MMNERLDFNCEW